MKISRASPTSVRQMATIWRSAIDSVLSGASRSSVDAEPGEHPLRLLPHRPPPDQPRPRAEDVAEGDVLGDGHLRKQREVLPDDADAEGAGRDRRHRVDPLAEVVHLGAGIGRIDAGDDLDQRALARAVLAGEAVHFPGQHLERDVLERAHAAEGLRDMREAERRRDRARISRFFGRLVHPAPPALRDRLYSRFVWLARITSGSTSTSARSFSIITSNRTNNAPS